MPTNQEGAESRALPREAKAGTKPLTDSSKFFPRLEGNGIINFAKEPKSIFLKAVVFFGHRALFSVLLLSNSHLYTSGTV